MADPNTPTPRITIKEWCSCETCTTRRVIEGMRMAEDCVEAERCKIGAIDGYDYTRGQEYGLRLATIVIRAEISRLLAGGTTEPIQSTTVPKDQK